MKAPRTPRLPEINAISVRGKTAVDVSPIDKMMDRPRQRKSTAQSSRHKVTRVKTQLRNAKSVPRLPEIAGAMRTLSPGKTMSSPRKLRRIDEIGRKIGIKRKRMPRQNQPPTSHRASQRASSMVTSRQRR